MKGAKHLNMLVPALILACIALFYFDERLASEGFAPSAPSGQTATNLTLNPPNQTTTYRIYFIRNSGNIITPVKMTITTGAGTTNINMANSSSAKWSGAGFDIMSQKSPNTSIVIIPTSLNTKLIDFDVYSWRGPGGWTFSTSSLQTDYKVGGFEDKTGVTLSTPVLRKNRATGVTNTQIALPLPSKAPAKSATAVPAIIFENLQFQQQPSMLTGDSANGKATIRIDLNFKN